MRIGVILPNWVGDVVMATPTLRALRQLAGREGRLVGIMRPYLSKVLEGSHWFDAELHYEKSKLWQAFPKSDLVRRLQAERLDSIIVLTNSFRTAWLAWRSGARERIGYRKEWRSVLLTNAVELPLAADGLPLETVEGYAHLAAVAGRRPDSLNLELATTSDDEWATDLVWQRLQLPPGDRVVVLNSGGAFGAAKLWPAEYFSELARSIVRNNELSVLVNCGPGERELAKTIVQQAADSRVVSLAECETLPFGLTKACIRRSRLLVTTDSGPRFFGVAFNRPVVTLFGPTDPRMTRLPYDRETCVKLALDCQPCMARTCPLGHHRCMRELTVDRVYEAVRQLLERTAKECAA